MPSNKVLIIVGDATETLDTMYPYYRLIEAGFQPVVAAIDVPVFQTGFGFCRRSRSVKQVECRNIPVIAGVGFHKVKQPTN